jgi:AcrR family transcriptional regulator
VLGCSQLMSAPTPTALLDVALTCFTERGLQAASTDYIERAAGISHGRLYRTVPSKADLVAAVYAYALAQLQATLATQGAPASKHESLQEQLRRWWQLLAEAALAQPRAFTFWRLYRSSVYAPAPTAPVLGPFAPLAAPLLRLPGTRGWAVNEYRAVSPALLLTSLVAQWTAVVEVVSTDPSCQANAALRQRLLTHGYSSWWQSLQLPTTLPALPYEAGSA